MLAVVRREEGGVMARKKFTIDRSKWACGDVEEKFNTTSMLRDPKSGAMCCLGFYLKSCGVPNKELDSRALPSSLNEKKLPASTTWLLGPNLEGEREGHNNRQDDFTSPNDDLEMAQNSREAKIRALFAEHDIDVEFVGRSPRVRKSSVNA